MKEENPLRDKSYAFAVKSVKLCFSIQDNKKEYLLTKQFMRSATSIAANVEEALGGQSEKDFLHKISIAYKEARESHYWLRLMFDVEIISEEIKDEFIQNIEELLKILGSIQRTIKSRMK